MNKVKYRAWDDVKEKMLYVGEEEDVIFGFDSNGIVATDITADDEEFRTLHHLKYMQYSGVKDKNGKEGFHKDIWLYHGVLYTVEWDEENASFYLKHSSHKATVDDHIHMSSFANGEIVGNEFENPELIPN